MCRADVSGKPRVKDAEGRYHCQACAVKAGLSVASGGGPGGKPAPASGEDAVLARLVEGSPMLGAAPCPGCGTPMPAQAKICTACGHNTASGKPLRTRVMRAPKSPAGGSGPSRGSTIAIGEINPLIPAGLVILVHVALAIYFGTDPSEETAKVFVYGTAGIGLVVLLYIVVSAFRAGEAIWGLVALGMLLPCFNFIMLIGLLYYLFAVSSDRVGRYAFLANFLGGIAGWLLAFTVAGETLRDAAMNPFAGAGGGAELGPESVPETEAP